MRLLLVEDDVKLLRALQRGLQREGYAVDLAQTGGEALSKARAYDYDAVVLDVMLPGPDGFAVCQELRSNEDWVPVLMLTARDHVKDRIRGLDAGADDYLVKPFDFGELLARLRALIRREPTERPAIIEVGDLRLDPARRAVTRAGRTVELTPREFALLHFLARNAGEVVPRAELLEHVWDDSDETSTNVVDVYVGLPPKEVGAPIPPPGADPHGAWRGLCAGVQVRLPIRARLTAWYAALLAAIMVALGGFLTLQLKSDLEQDIEREVRAGSAQIALGYAKEGPADFRDVSRTVLPHGELRGAGPVSRRSRPGRLRGAAGPPADRTPRGDQGRARRASRASSRSGSAPTTSASGESSHPSGVAAGTGCSWSQSRCGTSRSPCDQVLLLLLLAGPAALAATALGGWWLARKALLPVDRMTSQAEEIGIDRLDDRIALPPARDEIGRLAETLNAMLDRLERGVEEKRRMVADASHELRTPLAAMRAELDVSLMGDDLPPAGREVLESTREEVDRMSRIVDNLLTLARVDEGRLELLTTTVNLDEAADAAARPLRPLATAKNVQLTLNGPHCEAQADPQRLNQALTQLHRERDQVHPARRRGVRHGLAPQR